ncbi:NAD-dependent epimerase/dehydratase family protein [Pseudothauera rhizosphaerae]|nr:NAD-dependent epimerase/dehydratase family protein [Pseudothauera rhizosphaerae]
MAPRKPILLIGGTGFFGLALARALAGTRNEVHILSRTAQPGIHNGITFHRGSQDNASIVEPLLARAGTVIHLASTTTPGLSAGRSSVDAIENLLPAARLMEIMAARPPERLFFVSTGGAIYGNPEYLPVDETHPSHPLSSHAAGKAALEGFFSSFAHCAGIPLTILRPSNLYGPGQTLRNGFGLVRTLLDKARRGKTFELWGEDSTVRDYLFIDDAVDAVIALLGSARCEGTYNLGAGIGTTTDELLTLMSHVTQCSLEVIRKPARKVDVRAVYLDCTRLERLTGWKPKIDLEQGIRRTWQWLVTSPT